MRWAYFLCLRISSLFDSLFCIVLEIIVLMKKILHSLENFTQLKLRWYSKSIKTSYLIPKYDISSTGNFSTPNVALIQTISKSYIRSNSNKLRTIPFSKYDEYSSIFFKKILRDALWEETKATFASDFKSWYSRVIFLLREMHNLITSMYRKLSF